jgi:hypothetical protein
MGSRLPSRLCLTGNASLRGSQPQQREPPDANALGKQNASPGGIARQDAHPAACNVIGVTTTSASAPPASQIRPAKGALRAPFKAPVQVKPKPSKPAEDESEDDFQEDARSRILRKSLSPPLGLKQLLSTPSQASGDRAAAAAAKQQQQQQQQQQQEPPWQPRRSRHATDAAGLALTPATLRQQQQQQEQEGHARPVSQAFNQGMWQQQEPADPVDVPAPSTAARKLGKCQSLFDQDGAAAGQVRCRGRWCRASSCQQQLRPTLSQRRVRPHRRHTRLLPPSLSV